MPGFSSPFHQSFKSMKLPRLQGQMKAPFSSRSSSRNPKSILKVALPSRQSINQQPTSLWMKKEGQTTETGVDFFSRLISKSHDSGSSVASPRKFSDTSLSDGMKSVIPFEVMSEIQAATLDAALAGRDVLAQAKTGTGKTLAFLIPAIESLRTSNLGHENSEILVLIISPTRELAAQIARECAPLLHGTHLGVQCVVGGTNIKVETNKLNRQPCQILVATPGRLKDHLLNHQLDNKMKRLKFFILDEADRLLDMGFKPDVETIISSLPDRRSVDRQSMLFSATIPNEVLKVKSLVLKPGHAHISTLKEEDINAHLHVPQGYVIAHLHDHLAVLHQLIAQEMKTNGPKAKLMVFFPTARATGLAAEVLRNSLKDSKMPVYEIHSRISQNLRTKVAKQFNNCQNGVLATSDVSGRGVDYPHVTTVIQVGLPATSEDYVHRLGRTARGGAEGRGIIILTPFEERFIKLGDMSSMPLKPYQLPGPIDRSITNKALDQVSDVQKEQAYQAWLGYYKGKLKLCKFTPEGLVKTANQYVKDGLRYGPDVPPGLSAKTIGMMGLKGTPGLRIVKPEPKPFVNKYLEV